MRHYKYKVILFLGKKSGCCQMCVIFTPDCISKLVHIMVRLPQQFSEILRNDEALLVYKSYYSEHFVKTPVDLKMGHFYPKQHCIGITESGSFSGSCSHHKGKGINLNVLVHINDKLVSSLSFGKYSVAFMILINITAGISF